LRDAIIADNIDSDDGLESVECSKCQSVVGDSRFVKDRQAGLVEASLSRSHKLHLMTNTS
jgi:hypothetical protein